MDILGILAELHGQRDRITQAIEALESLNGTSVPSAKVAAKSAAPAVVKIVKTASSKKRTVSPEARQRMSEAQQKRWAKKKRAAKAAAKKAAVVVPAAVKPAKAAPVAKGARKPMNPATKKKLALAAKARWAAKKAPAKTS